MRNIPYDTTLDVQRNAGFTLVELMIAMAIGLFLMAGAIGMLSQFRDGHRFLDGFSEVQENGRFAVQFVSRDVRMAGFPADTFAGHCRGAASTRQTPPRPRAGADTALRCD